MSTSFSEHRHVQPLGPDSELVYYQKTPLALDTLVARGTSLTRLERQVLIVATGRYNLAELTHHIQHPDFPAAVLRLEAAGLLMRSTKRHPSAAQPAPNAAKPAPQQSSVNKAPEPHSQPQPQHPAEMMAPPLPALTRPLKLKPVQLQKYDLRSLESVVMMSHQQKTPITLARADETVGLDALVIDAQSASEAKTLLLQQPWLAHVPIIWLGESATARGQFVMPRPINWFQFAHQVHQWLIEHKTAAALLTSQSRRVLVADDSEVVRRQLSGLLMNEGLSVSEAHDGESALAVLRHQPHDCVLLDVLMPGANGYDICRAIKSSKHSAIVPAVIMLTSKGSPIDKMRGKMAGCDAYLSKPVEVARLKATLGKYVSLYSQNANTGG